MCSELVTVWLFLSVLVTPCEVARETGRQSFVVFEVTKTLAKFARSWHPDQRSGHRVEAIVELRCAYAKGAQVVADHSYVIQPICDFAPGPNA